MDKPKRSLKRKTMEPEIPLGEVSRIPGKLHHGLREIRKAAKKTKTFETQKLVKKLKELRKKGEGSADVAEHEAQLDVLKNIDHEAFANTATKSKIMKDRVLSQHEQIQETLSQELTDRILSTSVLEGPAAKVHSRFLSSKILATEISSLCDDLRGLLGHERKKLRIEVAGIDRENIDQAPETSELHGIGPSRESHMTVTEDMDSEEEEKLINETGWESGSVDEEEEHDNGEDWGSKEHSSHTVSGELDQKNDSNSAVAGNKALGRSEMSPKPPAKASKVSNASSSTFLPSLSVGFVRGSDDSDFSDNEAQIADSGQKKNRRGQRARRAIWEKKYGRNANHKKKEFEAKSRNLRLDTYQGKWEGGRRGSQRFTNTKIATDGGTRPKYGERGPGRHPASSHPLISTPPKDKPLHPSWEAKRLQKEKQSAGIVASQGTKIKFSD